MKIINVDPPNIKQIEAVLGPDKTKANVYCYGNTIYNPNKLKLEPHIIVHEKVHSEQQRRIGIDYWWMRYLDDKNFRLENELEAYAIQYKYVKDLFKDAIAKLFLTDISEVLASETYGNILTIHQAETKIRKLAEKI